MKSTQKAAKAASSLMALAVFAVILAACPTDSDDTPTANLPVYPFNTPAEHREMVQLKGATVNAVPGSNVFSEMRGTVTMSAFKIAKFETTYELWKEVYDWSLENGYEYSYSGGIGGGAGTESDAWPEEQKKSRPVIGVPWRETVAWCNAYSEMSGKEPVYYTVNDTLLKNARSYMVDAAKIKPGANGFRLPTELEWEYAARGGNPANEAEWNHSYARTTDDLDAYAWHRGNTFNLGESDKDYGVHPVGLKEPNGAKLYDMSGNVSELCWDWYRFGPASSDMPLTGSPVPTRDLTRVVHGGYWNGVSSNCLNTAREYLDTTDGSPDVGFRLASN
jgi:formylglycine-generating enzyme required for sulfatase activity